MDYSDSSDNNEAHEEAQPVIFPVNLPEEQQQFQEEKTSGQLQRLFRKLSESCSQEANGREIWKENHFSQETTEQLDNVDTNHFPDDR